jgi:KaiC/GvpD/RAD55 family RecA-like ATPase
MEGLWVPIVSDILGREIGKGKFLIGLHEPAAHWLFFVLTLASAVLSQGQVVNVMTTNTPPREIRRILNRAVSKLGEPGVGNRLVISDMYTWRTGGKSDEAETVESLSIGKTNLEFAAWRQRSASFDFVVSDDMSAFMRYNEERVFIQWLDRWVAYFREVKGIRLYSFIKHFHSDAMYAYLESVADGIIELDYRENAGVLEHVLRVKSMKGMPHPTTWRKLTVNSDGTMQLSK